MVNGHFVMDRMQTAGFIARHMTVRTIRMQKQHYPAKPDSAALILTMRNLSEQHVQLHRYRLIQIALTIFSVIACSQISA